MDRRRLQFSLRFLLFVLTVAAILAFWFRPRYIVVDFAVDKFRNELEWPSGKPYVGANVRVTNRSPNSIWYRAASPESPDFQSFQKRTNQWQWSAASIGATEWTKFHSGDTFVFIVPLYDDAQTLKVGLRFATGRGGEESDVWSKEFAVQRPPQPP